MTIIQFLVLWTMASFFFGPIVGKIIKGVIMSNSASLQSGINTSPGLITETWSQGLTSKKTTLHSFSHRGAIVPPLALTSGPRGAPGDRDHASFPDRTEFVQTGLDILAVIYAILFVAVTGIGIAFALFAALFLSF